MRDSILVVVSVCHETVSANLLHLTLLNLSPESKTDGLRISVGLAEVATFEISTIVNADNLGACFEGNNGKCSTGRLLP